MRGNLHNHSLCSDGIKSVLELNDLAIKNNIDVLAITDHDTIEQYYEIEKIKSNVKLITGVEMKCKYNDESIHILGYFNSKPSEEAFNFFNDLKIKRDIRCKKMIENLKNIFNIDISYDEVKKLANGAIGRPHIARVISNKYNISFNDAFDKYINNDSPAYVMETNLSVDDVFNFLRKNNALIVMAHPIQIKKSDFRELLKYGFDGIEAFHPDQDEDYSNMIKDIAKEYNLFITGGDDYHGDSHNGVFGEYYIEGNDLDIFLDRLDRL